MEVIQSWPNTSEVELPTVAAAVLAVLEKAATDSSGAIVLTLAGDLGAGKTTFSQALARLLGVTDTVTSPTFVIMKQYLTTNATFTKLVHIDAYRIDDEEELAGLGWDELLGTEQTLVLLEWPSRVPNLLPETCYTLTLDITDTNRDINLHYGH